MAADFSARDASPPVPRPQDEGAALVDVRQVCYRHGALVILDKVSFTVRPGRRLFIVGPPGAGKTTLLHILLGRLRPQSGWVEILGRPPAQLGERKPQIGYFPQPPLSDYRPGATGREVLRDGIMPFDLVKRDRAGADRRVEEALEAVGRPDLAEQRLDGLAPDEMCQLRLARALVNRPRLLALDHPEAPLTADEGAAFYGLVQRIVADRGLALVALTPAFEPARTLADAVLLLNQRPLYYGDPATAPAHGDAIIVEAPGAPLLEDG